ncbi:HAD-IIB family hydrolase [Faecalibacterium sp.]|uniref:HAD-IIB family hydrolase n=1 Tax=Faecalibacterium sp. TaxID=1971605 RepID=UPI003A8DA92C
MLQSFPLVRLAALDLDGTLLNRNNEVTLATRQAIARAVEHGVVVVPATGRPLASLPPVVAKLPGIRYAITSNGAAVWDLGDDPMGAVHSRYANAAQRHTSEPACLLHRLMPTEVAREAFDLFQQYDGELSVFSDGLAIKTPDGIAKLTSRTAHFLSSEARQNLTDGRFTVIPGIESWMSRHAHEIEKLCMFFDSTEKTAAALPKFQAIPGVAVVQGSPDNIEVTAAGVDKGSALLALADLLGIPHKNTLAVGDSENDRAMLEKAGIAAVMANGMPQIKAIGSIVSEADCDHDGVAELFGRLGI